MKLLNILKEKKLTKMFKELSVWKQVVLIVPLLVLLTGTSYALVNGFYGSSKPATQNQDTADNYEGLRLDTSPTIGTNSTTEKQDTAVKQCRQVSTPHGTVEEPAIWLYKGQMQIANKGIDGKKEVCIDKTGAQTERVISKAFDEVRYVGTKEQAKSEPEPAHYSYEEALQLAKDACKKYAVDSTDLSDCKTKEMHKYGY